MNTQFGAAVVSNEAALHLNMISLSPLSPFQIDWSWWYSLWVGLNLAAFIGTWETLPTPLAVFTMSFVDCT